MRSEQSQRKRTQTSISSCCLILSHWHVLAVLLLHFLQSCSRVLRASFYTSQWSNSLHLASYEKIALCREHRINSLIINVESKKEWEVYQIFLQFSAVRRSSVHHAYILMRWTSICLMTALSLNRLTLECVHSFIHQNASEFSHSDLNCLMRSQKMCSNRFTVRSACDVWMLVKCLWS